MKEVLEQALKAQDRDLCDHCLGRLFAHVGTGTTNQKRGEELRALIDQDRQSRGLGKKLKHEMCGSATRYSSGPPHRRGVELKLQEVHTITFGRDEGGPVSRPGGGAGR
jgi:tRNA U54 and U55 pseudouridine synthase Pus10